MTAEINRIYDTIRDTDAKLSERILELTRQVAQSKTEVDGDVALKLQRLRDELQSAVLEAATRHATNSEKISAIEGSIRRHADLIALLHEHKNTSSTHQAALERELRSTIAAHNQRISLVEDSLQRILVKLGEGGVKVTMLMAAAASVGAAVVTIVVNLLTKR